MGFDIDDYNKLAGKFSNTSFYKMTGNSVCVPVLEGIIGNLLKTRL
jgi:site-specific DNA-cytosine methylase